MEESKTKDHIMDEPTHSLAFPFLYLPREIRDMIYLFLLTSERPQPGLDEAEWLFKYRRVFDNMQNGEYGCSYSLARAPKTPCAGILATSRQLNAEMNETIHRVKRKKDFCPDARLDCIAEDESFHYFTWRRISVVKTTTKKPLVLESEGSSRMSMFPWADRLFEKYMSGLSNEGRDASSSSTAVALGQLWIDVRLLGDRSGKWFRNSNPPNRTSWALCAALKRILEKGPDFSRKVNSAHTVTVEEVVFNVVPPLNVREEEFLPEGFPTDGMDNGVVHPKTVARELVDVWNKIWSGDEYKGVYYQVLLERIQRVRVCVDGETFRTRELRLELERGQAERRRIAARVGW